MSSLNVNNQSYPVFKGLQRPLEILGFQGRYIWWALSSVVGGVASLMIFSAVFSFLVGLLVCAFILCIGGGLIMSKQPKGLHSKDEKKGVFIYAHWIHI